MKGTGPTKPIRISVEQYNLLMKEALKLSKKTGRIISVGEYVRMVLNKELGIHDGK